MYACYLYTLQRFQSTWGEAREKAQFTLTYKYETPFKGSPTMLDPWGAGDGKALGQNTQKSWCHGPLLLLCLHQPLAARAVHLHMINALCYMTATMMLGEMKLNCQVINALYHMTATMMFAEMKLNCQVKQSTYGSIFMINCWSRTYTFRLNTKCIRCTHRCCKDV